MASGSDGMLKTLVKIVFFGALLAFIAAVFAAVLLLEPAPRVADSAPPSPQDVAATRDFVRGVRAALSAQTGAPASFSTDLDTLNAAVKLGARFIPGFRGTVALDGGVVEGHASVPVRIGRATQWLNVTLAAPEFDGQLALSKARFGRVDLPASFALGLLRVGGNLVLGNAMGDTITRAASRMEVEGRDLRFTMALGEMGGNGIMRGIFGTLRGSDMPGSEDIARYYNDLREAMERGDLPVEGSYLPYLLFTLEAAERGAAREGAANAYTSALFALTLVCGAQDFTLIVGGLVTGDLDGGRVWSKACSEVTFNGRIDSRRHFTTAAAIQAASNRGFAVSVGEFKELHDTLKAGGFDFTDIAANNSGIRMSNAFMAAPLADWAGLRARIKGENDVIISFGGVPTIMSDAEFKERYGDIDSERYNTQLAEIEARIDTLALHR